MRVFNRRLSFLIPLWAVFCGFIGCLSATDPNDNLLRNSGFEEDKNQDHRADRWFSYPSSIEGSTNPVVDTIQDAHEAAAGQAFLRISREDGKSALLVTQHFDPSEVERVTSDPGKTLVLKGKIRAAKTDESKASINIQIYGHPKAGGERAFAGRMSTPIVDGSDHWQEVTVAFKLSDIISENTEVDDVEVNCLLNSPQGQAEFDDLSLTFQ